MITYGRLGECGRLGNQLWQIASTAGIADALGEKVYLPPWTYQPYFCVPDEWFDLTKGRIIQAHSTELVNHMDPRAREYLQDFGLWENIQARVWKWFQPSDEAIAILGEQNAWFLELERPLLSVHVRRGDNAAAPNNYHPLRPWSYYEQAIQSLHGEFASIIVFSDDPEWCRTAFGGYEVEYPIAFFVGTPRKKEHEVGYRSEPVLDWIDLFLMSLCDLHIIGNSTFAWWGAFLSHDASPIYPSPWFGTELSYIDESWMFPYGWKRINHEQIVV